MEAYYVTQSGSGTGSGLDYENSVALASVVWAAGKTYFLCDTITSIVAPNAAGTAGNPIVIRGDYEGHPGHVHVASGACYTASGPRDYITLQDLALTTDAAGAAILTNGNYLTIERCTLTSTKSGVEIQSSVARNHITVSDCDITCTSAAASGGVYLEANSTNVYADLIIRNNRISNVGTTGSYGISLRQAGAAACARWSILDNLVGPAGGSGIRLNSDEDSGTVADVVIAGNTVTGAKAGIRCSKLRSSTSAYGKNVIRDNVCVDNGPSVGSGIEIVDCQWVDILRNLCSRQVTTGADGNGVLVGNDCASVRVVANLCEDNAGSATDNSGCGVMLLACPDAEVYGNRARGCRHGLWLSGAAGTLTGLVAHNTFAGCLDDGISIVNVVPAGAVTVQGNIFVGTGTGYGCDRESGGAGGEQSLVQNIFYGFLGAYRNQSAGTGDILADPLVHEDYRLAQASPGYCAGAWLADVRAADDVPLPERPNLGADQRGARARAGGHYPRGG